TGVYDVFQLDNAFKQPTEIGTVQAEMSQPGHYPPQKFMCFPTCGNNRKLVVESA
ncbi:hypothetical protein EZS27_044260, partial [termite gut metagenome]